MGKNFLKIYNGTTYSPISADPASPVEGDVQFSDGTARTKGLWVYQDGAWSEVGSGTGTASSEINYVVNSDFEVDNSNWTSTDQTNFNMNRTTSNPLRGIGSMIITKAASNQQNDYVYSDTFTIDIADRESMMTLEFDGDFTHANYVSGDMTARIYSIDDSSYLSGSYDIPAGKGKHSIDFQTLDSTNTDYQVRFFCASTNANLYNAKIDYIVFGPQRDKVYGTPSTNIEAYTPTFTSFGTVSAVSFSYSRLGSHLIVNGEFTSGTTTAVEARVSLPTGLAISTSQTGAIFGKGAVGISSAEDNDICVLGDDGDTYFTFGFANKSTGGFNPLSPLYGSFFVSNGDKISFDARVPIQGWSTNVVMSETTQNRAISLEAAGNAGQAITADVTDIPFISTIDTLSKWDGDQYTIDEDGIYSIKGSVFCNSNATRYIKLHIDGSLSHTLGGANDSASAATFFDDDVTLQKGDVISLRMWPTSTLSNNVSLHHISINKKNTGSQTIAQSEQVAVSSSITSGQAVVSGNTVLYAAERDTHGALASGVFTAPRDGYYNVTAQVKTASVGGTTLGYNFTIRLKKNGTTDISQGFVDHVENTGSRQYSTVLAENAVWLNSGETLEIQFNDGLPACNLTTVARENRFCIISA